MEGIKFKSVNARRPGDAIHPAPGGESGPGTRNPCSKREHRHFHEDRRCGIDTGSDCRFVYMMMNRKPAAEIVSINTGDEANPS